MAIFAIPMASKHDVKEKNSVLVLIADEKGYFKGKEDKKRYAVQKVSGSDEAFEVKKVTVRGPDDRSLIVQYRVKEKAKPPGSIGNSDVQTGSVSVSLDGAALTTMQVAYTDE